ncbi:alpha/beta fold hydrolase [Thalassotalea psychrophila]|uniref:Alpha/beta fold hydrolase n=1 Tax=Thalassotalea psychrophila TaxID=3065647 RepID=A0ABY9TUY7_9GAMM|nr:alpha/beta fold hydrolase [Colwelliaceae bacterium SQ149]
MRIFSILIFIALLGNMQAMATPFQFTQEHQLIAKQPVIDRFWHGGEFASFKSYDQLDIHYALFFKPENTQCIVISLGRSESYLKYKELIFDLASNGYNVAMIDHRGQGLSERELDDKNKGYVKDFNDYVVDMHQWLSSIVEPKCSNEIFLLAHSMGGTIATRYVQQFPHTFNALVLSSPMIAVDGGAIPDWLGKPLIKASHFIDGLFNEQSSYFFGHGPYKEKVFAGNDLMQSEIRHQLFRQTYQQNPQLRLGGITLSWLNSAIETEAIIFENLSSIQTPTLLLQAEKDTVVSNIKQHKFCQQLNALRPQSCPNGKPVVIKAALHELLFEKDEIRNEALNQTLIWFNQHSQN